MSMGSTSTQNTVTEPWKEAQPALKAGITGAQNLYESGGFNLPVYQGQRVAELSPMEATGLNLTRLGARRGYGAMKNALGTVQDVASFGPQDVTRIGDTAMADAMNAVFDRFNNAGMEGSSLNQAEAISAATRALAPIRYGANEDATNRQMQASQLASQIGAGMTQPGMAMAGAGSRMTAQEQAQLDAEAQKFNEMSRQDLAEQERFAQLAAMYGGMGGTQSGKSTPSTFDTLGGIGQTALSAAMAYSLLCDRRLKRDIRKIGEWRGVAVYEFRYLWEKVLRFGPMADEVPDRARVRVGGIDMVNLGAI